MTPASLVVIGGSAGALDALLTVLPALPPLDVPIAIVLHQAPTHTNLLPDLLSRTTRRPVVEAEDKLELAAGTIYVAPPNYHLLIERGGGLALSVDPLVNYSRPSIDVLFESAADAFGAAAVGVVLSGANADGAAGLHRIAAAGGIAVVQDPATASHAAMPRAAIERVGPAARVVSLPAMAALLGGLPGVIRATTQERP